LSQNARESIALRSSFHDGYLRAVDRIALAPGVQFIQAVESHGAFASSIRAPCSFVLEADMSVAGILASSLFTNAVSQATQKSSSAASKNTDTKSAFGTLQQGLLASSSNSSSSGTSVTGQLSQVGEDLESGNLTAAQADFSTLKTTLAQYWTQMLHSSTGQASSGSNGSSSSSSGQSSLSSASSDPLAGAMLAYGSLQQSQTGGALNASMLPTASTFSITA
jgi:hypothetical protein